MGGDLVGLQGDLILQEQDVLNNGRGQSRGHRFRYRMLFIQVDDRRNGGHRGRGEGGRVDHVQILNPTDPIPRLESNWRGGSAAQGRLRLRNYALVASTVDESQRPV